MKKFAFVLGILLVVFVYYKYNPATQNGFPQCLFFRMTGWQCPSCGSQRAVHCLLHGEWRQALSYNPFLFVVIPYLIGIIYSSCADNKIARKIRSIFQTSIAVKLFVFTFCFWWIIRNIINL